MPNRDRTELLNRHSEAEQRAWLERMNERWLREENEARRAKRELAHRAGFVHEDFRGMGAWTRFAWGKDGEARPVVDTEPL